MKKIFIFLINMYSKFISPLFPARCRFYPTCSAYAKEAYERHGVIKGTLLSTYRLLRCNPFNIGGVDYVPKKFNLFKMGKNPHK